MAKKDVHGTSRIATMIISPIVTASFTGTSPTAQTKVGTIGFTDMGGIAEYAGPAFSECSQYAFCVMYDGGTAQMATTTLVADAGASKKIGCAVASVASAYYGWFMRQGTFIGNFADDCAANFPVYTTATSGYVDDATVSNSLIPGLFLNTTGSLATALTCVAALPMYVHPFTNPA